jgi:hypothetical protein
MTCPARLREKATTPKTLARFGCNRTLRRCAGDPLGISDLDPPAPPQQRQTIM